MILYVPPFWAEMQVLVHRETTVLQVLMAMAAAVELLVIMIHRVVKALVVQEELELLVAVAVQGVALQVAVLWVPTVEAVVPERHSALAAVEAAVLQAVRNNGLVV